MSELMRCLTDPDFGPINRRRLALMPIRIVILLPFALVAKLGEAAEAVAEAIEPYLPQGLSTPPHRPRRPASTPKEPL